MAKIIKLKSGEEDDNKKKIVEDANYYEELLKANPLDQKAYHRLMIIYRKEKNYKKELQLINKAIREYERFHKSHIKKKSKKITMLSKGLSIGLGLVDKKGKPTHDAEPIAGWKKRREGVLKKLGR